MSQDFEQRLRPGRGSEKSVESGMALLEVLIYLSLALLVSGMAFALFYRTEEQSRSLRRSTDDIAAVLKVGERWRTDIRAAIAPPVIDAGGLEPGIRVRKKDGEVRYFMRDGGLWRQSGPHPTELLSRVQASIFEKDQRRFVAAWRWSVELKRYRHQGSARPLFSFTAVPEKKP